MAMAPPNSCSTWTADGRSSDNRAEASATGCAKGTARRSNRRDDRLAGRLGDAVDEAAGHPDARAERPQRGSRTRPDQLYHCRLYRTGGASRGKYSHGAQDALEALCYSIECAVLTNYDVIGIVQRVMSVDTLTDITADGHRHLGGAQMTFIFEVVEVFDPVEQSPIQPVASDLQNLKLHNDMIGTFDPTGTYSNLPFPDSIAPAPRTAGPDGRDEGALDITLPQ